MTTMPFGRHRGELLEDIDTGYLQWLLTIDLRDWLRAAVETEIQARAGWSHRREHHPPRSTAIMPAALRATADEIVTAGLRALTRRYHPDCGGTHAQMVSVNLAAEALRQAVAR